MAAAAAVAGPSPTAPAVALPFLVHDVGPGYHEPQSQYGIAGRTLVDASIGLLQTHRSAPQDSALCAVMVLDLDAFEYWLCTVGGSKWERHVYALTMYDADDQPVERHMARHHAAVGGKVYFEFTDGNELGFLEFECSTPYMPSRARR